MKKRIALIPAYEPEMLLIELLERLKNAGFTSVVVDDGSKEGYQEIFKRAQETSTVLTHAENQGKGAALKTGFAYIKEHFPEECTIVTLDADGQHTVEDAGKVCEYAEEHPDSLVLGSRRLKEKVPLRSRFGNSLTRLVYRLSTGVRVHDTQTGLRAFSMQLLPELEGIEGERYEYEMNVLLACGRRHIPIREIEIETIYLNNNAASHFNVWKDSARIYREILKFSASSFLAFVIDYLMYSILTIMTAGMEVTYSILVSNVLARIISASVNFHVNRKFVFGSQEKVGRSAAKYFLLAVFILAGNTLFLNLLSGQWGMNRYGAKLLTELLFFIVSWLIQRTMIFRK